ncbi:hypothetical protein [Terrarubrum flagellatum]|uniref:hypothetical protein n=1 Tax=Terrirubrum flagellatum TaxID=2895980 RepID=UPI003145053A
MSLLIHSAAFHRRPRPVSPSRRRRLRAEGLNATAGVILLIAMLAIALEWLARA